MFHTIAPVLVSKGFLVIVPDLPGMGQSVRTTHAPLTSKNAADALATMIAFLGLEQLHVFAYDKGCAPATLLARDHPKLVKSLIVSEYALPGFGHEIAQQPMKNATLFDHWHLGIFTIPEVAVFLIRGREEQFLTWYFWHSSYSGLNAIRDEHFTHYMREWYRPGGLESAVEFLGGSIWEDMEEFKSFKEGGKLEAKILAMGGEASMGNEGMLKMFWGSISASPLETASVPKAGHWLGDENPHWVAEYIAEWIGRSDDTIAAGDLTWLDGGNSGRKEAIAIATERAAKSKAHLMPSHGSSGDL